jgi:hypothetical protein
MVLLSFLLAGVTIDVTFPELTRDERTPLLAETGKISSSLDFGLLDCIVIS